MPVQTIDHAWFGLHPGRQYRLRRQTTGELAKWPVPPREGLTGWCIIRKRDGAVELFALATGESFGDCDCCLAPLFRDADDTDATGDAA